MTTATGFPIEPGAELTIQTQAAVYGVLPAGAALGTAGQIGNKIQVVITNDTAARVAVSARGVAV